MKIAYRRYSGAIGMSELEQGERGLWLEKRIALHSYLQERGHKVDFVSRMTKYSKQIQNAVYNEKEHKFLIVEFGSLNEGFYKEDIEETLSIIARHKGKGIFICDDPDLFMDFKDIPADKRKNWSIGVNALNTKYIERLYELPVLDLPFASLMEFVTPNDQYGTDLVYLGRPGGRKKQIDEILKSKVRLKVYSRPKDWTGFGITIYEQPGQTERKAFYNKQMGSLVFADNKHKQMGWRTGRAYHAVMAGCPSIVEFGHTWLQEFNFYASAIDLEVWQSNLENPENRKKIWEEQIAKVLKTKEIMDRSLDALGL